MIGIKLNILEKIYGLYDEILKGFDFYCSKGCSTCCTRNVTVTSLETLYLAERLLRTDTAFFGESLKKAVSLSRFIPKMTSNGFARLVMAGEEEPEEIIDPSWRPCPFLGTDGACLVYEERPFNCRCMHSEEKCEDGGFSVLHPFIVTLNNVFLQYIEHLDKIGFVTNMTDACLWMLDEKNRASYIDEQMTDILPGDFVRCETMPFLMVPPEHQEKIRPVLRRLSEIGSSFS